MVSHTQAVSHVSKDVVGQHKRAPEERQAFKVPLLLPLYLNVEEFYEWAMLGSNQRPLPCEGESNSSLAFSTVHECA
jgi:hypothetical protein